MDQFDEHFPEEYNIPEKEGGKGWKGIGKYSGSDKGKQKLNTYKTRKMILKHKGNLEAIAKEYEKKMEDLVHHINKHDELVLLLQRYQVNLYGVADENLRRMLVDKDDKNHFQATLYILKKKDYKERYGEAVGRKETKAQKRARKQEILNLKKLIDDKAKAELNKQLGMKEEPEEKEITE